jgi:hypothetical protein
LAEIVFLTFVRRTYIPKEMPLLAVTTQQRYRGVLEKYLLPPFGNFLLRDLTPAVLQEFFSVGLAAAYPTLGWESRTKSATSSPVFSRKQLGNTRCSNAIRWR